MKKGCGHPKRLEQKVIDGSQDKTAMMLTPIILMTTDWRIAINCYLCKCMYVFVTGPEKTGHVGTNYTLSHKKQFLSSESRYLNSVTCIIKPVTYAHGPKVSLPYHDDTYS